jgi:hypothetical protein
MSKIMQMRQGSQFTGLTNLCKFVKQRLGDNLNIVEIGCYCGHGTEIIANAFTNSLINCVDPWQKYTEDCSVYDIDNQELELLEAEEIFNKTISRYSNVVKNKISSVLFASKIKNESVDFVYIDGNHQYSSVSEDIITWLPKVKNKGILCGHDYYWESVQRATFDIFGKEPDMLFEDSSWLYFK